MHNSNWDNLRFVLAVIKGGSVSAAARELGVNHATVLRRVSAFEKEYGSAVFDKSANGYRLLPRKNALVRAVQDVENSVLSVQRLMQGANPLVSGVVRITSTDTICQFLLPKILETLRTQTPQLEIELLSSNSHLDFARMEADIFVRPALSLPDDMIAEKAGDLVFKAYGTGPGLQKWFDLKGPLAKSVAAQWLHANVAKEDRISGADSFVVLSQMARTGSGIAILPAFVGDAMPGVTHLSSRMPDVKVPIWVGTHQDFRDSPRIAAVRKCVMSHLAGDLAL